MLHKSCTNEDDEDLKISGGRNIAPIFFVLTQGDFPMLLISLFPDLLQSVRRTHRTGLRENRGGQGEDVAMHKNKSLC